MSSRPRHNRILAAFVVSFLCLNAVGLLCLSYCGGSVLASSSHCERMMSAAHCPHARQQAKEVATNSSPSVSVRPPSCCMMPVSMFPAPVEKRSTQTAVAVLLLQAERTNVTTQFERASREVPTFVYRPPPLDKRDAPSLTCVIRI